MWEEAFDFGKKFMHDNLIIDKDENKVYNDIQMTEWWNYFHIYITSTKKVKLIQSSIHSFKNY